MDPERFSAIAHRTHEYCNPISAGKIESILDLVAIGRYDRVVDFGCGKGELVIRLATRFGADVHGVDRSQLMIDEAMARAAARVPGSRVTFHAGLAAAFAAGESEIALASCVGSTHAFGDYRGALESTMAIVRPGGYLLLGEGYWKRTPEQDYLDFLECTESAYADHRGNVALGASLGLIPLHAVSSSVDEWDEYEWRYSRSIELFVREVPDDPEARPMLERIRSWRDGYLRWGRSTLGFGLYLFMKP